MSRRIVLACLALALGTPVAAEEECPVAFNVDEIVKAVEAAPGCKRANGIAQACAFGSSADVQIAGAVQALCEKDFLSGLKPDAEKAYKARLKSCARRYAGRDGTLYLSMAAFCASDVALTYSARAKR